MSSEGIQSWIDGQLALVNPENFAGQIGALVLVIVGALIVAAVFRQLSIIFPLDRPGAGVSKVPVSRPLTEPSALRSTAPNKQSERRKIADLDMSSRQKRKIVRTKPKKNYPTIEKAPSDPMFLPPYDTNVAYRDRIAMVGSTRLS